MKKLFLRKNNLLIIICLIIAQSLFSQTIEDCYVDMPDILNPTLSRQNRLELVGYHKAKQSDSVVNRFGNQAYLVSLDSLGKRIVVKNSSSSRFEMKVLLLDENVKVISIIRTICAPVCLSSVEFYDTAWNAIPVQFTMPKAIDWVNESALPKDQVDVQWIKNNLDIGFVSLTFTNQGQMIQATNNTLDFFSEADRKLISPFMNNSPILFKLSGRVWVRN